MKNLYVFFPLSILLIALTSCSEKADKATTTWTHFRGSNLDAIAVAPDLPINFNDSTNIIWKADIQGKGWSSPVVYDGQIWLTTALPDGKAMYAVCVDLESGDIIHDIKLYEPDSVWGIHAVNSYATPTPCIEGDVVYIHFGQYGTACLDTKTGERLWERTDLFCDHVQGPGSSLFIYKNMLIVHMEGVDVQFIVALDKRTGETIWRTDRPEDIYEHLAPIGRKAYTTPFIVNVDGKDIMISNGSAVCIAYDPLTGEEIWRFVQGEDSSISMPIVWDNKVFIYTSFFNKPDVGRIAELVAIDPSGKGDIAETHILWRKETPILQMLTPLVKDGLIYTVDTRSNIQCIDASNGELVWEEKVKGKFNGSPVYVSGKIYFPSTSATILVVAEGDTYNLLAENKLEGDIWATPAVVDNSMLIRTSKYLYRIGKR